MNEDDQVVVKQFTGLAQRMIATHTIIERPQGHTNIKEAIQKFPTGKIQGTATNPALIIFDTNDHRF